MRKWASASSAGALVCALALLAPPIGAQAPAYAVVHHAVSTRDAQAQAAFDRGLTLIYAFAPEEAQRAFERAARLDRHLAMAQWGIALALGSNFNIGTNPERERAAFAAIRRAAGLERYANAGERALIAALAQRYSGDPKADRGKLAAAYRDAMRKLCEQYPDDLDAAALFGGAILEVASPDELYKDGKPLPAAQELVAVLERVLARAPDHIGANHYYIHAVEASAQPQRATVSADRLLNASLEPAASHLMHMPAHIYARIGSWTGVVAANTKAIAAERELLHSSRRAELDPASDYHPHNLGFLIFGYVELGRLADIRTATAGDDDDGLLLTGMIALERWKDILALDAGATRNVPRFLVARGLALAATGENAAALEAVRLLETHRKEAPDLVKIGKDMIEARLARTNGETQKELGRLHEAYESRLALGYSEPPNYYYLRVAQTYGAALVRAGDAATATTIFRAQLDETPNDPMALAGLVDAQKRAR